MPKYTLHLKDGRWVGGFQCHRVYVDQELASLRILATAWGQPIVATKVSPRPKDGNREIHIVGPVHGLEGYLDGASES